MADDDALHAVTLGEHGILAGLPHDGVHVDMSTVFPDTSKHLAQLYRERWNGSSWAVQASADVGATDNLLTGAAAIPGTGSVWAVGFRLTSSNVDQTLIERGPWTGRASPSRHDQRLDGLAGAGEL